MGPTVLPPSRHAVGDGRHAEGRGDDADEEPEGVADDGPQAVEGPHDVQEPIEGLPLMEEDIDELETLITQVTQDIEDLDADLTAVEEGIPAPYDDTALIERIAQLEGQNQLLQQQLANLEDEQDDIKDATPSSAIGYAALVGVLIALAAFMMKRKGDDKLWVED